MSVPLATYAGIDEGDVEIWEQRESKIASTKTTISTKTIRRKFKSASVSIPPSLNLWSIANDDAQDKSNSLAHSSLSTLGFQQMQGYEDLESMQQGPMQWADDEDRQHSNEKESVSSIAFPQTREMIDGEGQRCKSGSSIPISNDRISHARYNSMPLRHTPVANSPQSHPRHSISLIRPSLHQSALSKGKTPLHVDNTAPSSEHSSPESNVLSLDQMSLRQRSMRSLQGIASAWVPSAVRSPYDSETESGSTTHLTKNDKEKRPVRLDRRRLDKAVSLAIEAAQASAQDEKAWKLKRRRLVNRRSGLDDLQENKHHNRNRFASLPWRQSQTITQRRPPNFPGDENQGALVPLGKRRTSDDDDEEVGEDSSQGTKKAGFQESEETDESLERTDEDEDEDDLADAYSVDLYVSSLGYLLSALSPKDIERVDEKHREEMKRKLEEALQSLEFGEEKGEHASDREEVIRLRVERELAILEQSLRQRKNTSPPSPSRAHRAAQASSRYERSRKQSIAGYLANSVIDLGLSVGAGALATASRGIASLLPVLEAQDGKVGNEMVFRRELTAEAVNGLDGAGDVASASSNKAMDAQPLITHSQWELTRTLAQSVASTMYGNLAAIAEQRKKDSDNSNNYNGNHNNAVTMYSSASPLITKPEDDSDQLLLMAATLARNVKRSPLPSQIRALTAQIGSLVATLDQRYSLRKRSADVALRKTGQALYYVRKNDLHVKALRMVWSVMEAGVAAMEAYRDEEEWKGEPPPPAAPRPFHSQSCQAMIEDTRPALVKV